MQIHEDAQYGFEIYIPLKTFVLWIKLDTYHHYNPVLINITASGRAREDEILKSVNLEPEKPIQQQELIP